MFSDTATSEAAAIYGMSQTIPDRGLVNLITWSYLDSLYITKAEKEAKDKLAIAQEEKKIAWKNDSWVFMWMSF